MAAERKEKSIRVLQIMETTDEKSPLNANQIVEKLDSEYTLGEIDRRSIYRDISMLQYCGYPIKQCKDKRTGWYMDKHAFDDWEIKLMMDAVWQSMWGRLVMLPILLSQWQQVQRVQEVLAIRLKRILKWK